MTLPSHACDGATESVMIIARQGTIAVRQGGVVDRLGAADTCQGVTTDRQGAIVDY
jgi:hypothetical protein